MPYLRHEDNGFLPVLLILSLFLAAGGCATQAKVERYKAPTCNAGTARTLTLVQVTGDPELRAVLRSILAREATKSDWWEYKDRHTAGIALFPSAEPGRTIRGAMPAKGEVFVRIDAYSSRVRSDHPDCSDKRKKDKEQTSNAYVRFAATVVNAKQVAVLAEREYTGQAGRTGSHVSRWGLVRKAAEDGIEHFLRDITPRRVVDRIVIDKEAGDMALVVDLVDRGQYAQAMRKLQIKRKRYPLRADIMYNLAVLTDARGDYRAALKLYDQALRLGYKSFYRRSRNACARRLREQEELGE